MTGASADKGRATLSGISSPAITRKVVDLPVPEPPMMPTASPRRILMLLPRRICFLPKDLCTLRSSISTSASGSGGEAAAVVGDFSSAGVIAAACKSRGIGMSTLSCTVQCTVMPGSSDRDTCSARGELLAQTQRRLQRCCLVCCGADCLGGAWNARPIGMLT